MSNTQHTPGPWSINDWPQANADIAIGAVGTPLIARVPLRDVSVNEQQANAALIAAAPELLEACIKTVEQNKHLADGDWRNEMSNTDRELQDAVGESYEKEAMEDDSGWDDYEYYDDYACAFTPINDRY
jgi:lysophospholipase L1-like esterase